MICKKCWWFEPLIIVDPMAYGCLPASCKHPDCFRKVRKQNAFGRIYYVDRQIKDIVDFVDDNDNCKKFQPFIIKREKKKWLGFIPYITETKIPNNQQISTS